MSKNIYIALYCKSLDNQPRAFDLERFVAYNYAGPFTHVQLCTSEKAITGGVKAINLTRNTNKVLYDEFDFEREGYCFIKIAIPSATWEKLDKLCQSIAASDNQFSKLEFYGFNRCCYERYSIHKRVWFCSELIMWVLQEVNLVPRDSIEPYEASCTTVYHYTRNIPGAIQCEKNPFFPKIVTRRPDSLFMEYKNITDDRMIELFR